MKIKKIDTIEQFQKIVFIIPAILFVVVL